MPNREHVNKGSVRIEFVIKMMLAFPEEHSSNPWPLGSKEGGSRLWMFGEKLKGKLEFPLDLRGIGPILPPPGGDFPELQPCPRRKFGAVSAHLSRIVQDLSHFLEDEFGGYALAPGELGSRLVDGLVQAPKFFSVEVAVIAVIEDPLRDVLERSIHRNIRLSHVS